MVGGIGAAVEFPRGIWYNLLRRNIMGLVKTRRLAAMHKQQRAKAGMKLPAMKGAQYCDKLHRTQKVCCRKSGMSVDLI